MSDQTRAADIMATVERLSGRPLPKDSGDEGLQIGSEETPVRQALVAWMGTREALLHAEKMKADLAIVHESLFYPYNVRLNPGETPDWLAWTTNRQRNEIIVRARLTVLRIHGSADIISIFDDAAERLGLGGSVSGEGLRKVYEIEPVSLRALVERVKSISGLGHVRVSCKEKDLDRVVHRVGMPWGGLGLYTNVGYQAWALGQGCDVLIAGEADSYGFRFSGESDVPMIETSHESSEIPGFRKFMELLAASHPDVTFEYHDNGNAWRWM